MDSGRPELKAASNTYQKIKSSSREQGQLKGLYLNAKIIINKLDLFQIAVHDMDPDKKGATESWANSEIFDSELILDGYVMFRHDRDTGIKGGGVMFMLKRILNQQSLYLRSSFQSMPGASWWTPEVRNYWWEFATGHQMGCCLLIMALD